jgi:AcrR family transcriptional regulator
MSVQRKGEAYHHGDLRRALIDAALELIVERGVDGLTLREAARRAGVTHSAPYRHFADKSVLVAAVRREGFELLHRHMLEAREALAGDPVAQVKASGVAYVRFAIERPAHFRVMFGPKLAEQAARDPELDAASRRAYAVLVDGLAACQAQGLVREGDLQRHAMTAWATVHGMAALLINGLIPRKEASVEELARAVTDRLYAGLAPPAAGAAGAGLEP